MRKCAEQMKKVLVVTGLGLIALSFGCGSGNSGIDADTPEGKGKASMVYGAISSNTDIGSLAGYASVKTNSTIPEDIFHCPLGGTVTSNGSYSGNETSGTISATAELKDCATSDDVCDTGDTVIANGSENVDITYTASTFSMEVGGKVTVSNAFDATCKIDLKVATVDLSTVNDLSDITFTGTVCGVDIADVWDLTAAEKATLCDAVIAGPATPASL